MSEMTLRFDIFKIEQDGNPSWLGSAQDLTKAKLRLQQLLPNESATRYLLLDQMTGNKTIVTADEIDLAKSTSSS